jgi:eukaryotic-like serine/threonine-protein kinase
MPDNGESLYQGRLIGQYRLGERIGEGGMGEVYLAERENEFRKRVAIKLIRPGMASLEVVRRFVIERQTLAALNHPQIVRLVDGGTTDDRLPYLVVDYVDGVPIDRYADEQKLSITGRLKLFVEVCGAVHHAHQSLVVHCDLKPHNILVTKEGVPMLLDFGIAKLLDPGSMGISDNVAKTRQRAFTPDYASPEQLQGKPVTTSTDIYALGVILYELLTGHSPYRPTSSDALADWIKSVCEDDAEAPSTMIRRVTEITTEPDDAPRKITPQMVSQTRESDPDKLHRRLRGDLDAIVLKALRKDPRDRYGSVDQMAEDIRRHLNGLPVLARRSTATYVARKFFSRHKISVTAAALILLAAGVGLATTLWEARLAARRFADVRQLAHTFLFDVHDSIQNLPGSTEARLLIARTGTEYLDRLAQDSRGDPSLELEVAEGYLKVGDVAGNPYGANRGDTVRALENYSKALRFAESAAAENHRSRKALQVLAKAHLELGAVLPFDSKTAEGLEHVKQAEKLYAQLAASAPNDTEAKLDLARVFDQEGDLQGGAQGINLGRRAEAEAAYRQALAYVPNLPQSDPLYFRATRSRAVGLVKLGDMQYYAHRIREALALYDQALHTAEGLGRANPNDPRAKDLLAVFLNKIATADGSIRDNPAASDAYRRSIALDEAILSADPGNDKARAGVVAGSKNLGDLLFYNMEDNPGALRSYQRAADMLETLSRSDPANVVWRERLAEILTCVASTMLRTGQPAEARRQAERGLNVAKELADRPGASQEQIYQYAYLGITVEPEDMQHPQTVLPYALKAASMSGEKEPHALHVLAQTYAGMQDYGRAVKTEEKALALFPPLAPGQPVSNVQQIVQDFLAECRKKLG